MKLTIYIVLLFSLTGAMAWYSPVWLSYGNPELTLVGMSMITMLINMNNSPDARLIDEDGHISFGRIIFVIVVATLVLYGFATVIQFFTSIYFAAGFLSYTLLNSLLRLIMGPLSIEEDA